MRFYQLIAALAVIAAITVAVVGPEMNFVSGSVNKISAELNAAVQRGVE